MAIVLMHELLSELGMTHCASTQEQSLIRRAIKRAEGAVVRYLGYDPEQASRTEFYPMHNFAQTSRQSVWEVEGNDAVIRRLSEISTDDLYVRHLPVRRSTAPVLSIDIDGRSGTSSGAFATNKSEGSDYWFNYDRLDSASKEVCTDGICRSYGRWPTTAGSVKLVYTAGYTANELKGEDSVIDASAIWDATLEEASRRARQAFMQAKSKVGFLSGPLESERLGDYSYKVNSSSSNSVFGGVYDLLPSSREKLSDFVNYAFRMAG